jgi:LPXTG-motif cell wall-anchored protein
MAPRTRLSRFGDFAIPWGAALWCVLVSLGAGEETENGALVLVGIVGGVAVALLLRRRREHPEWVTAIALAVSVPYLLFDTESVLPVAGIFAVGSLAATRPQRVSLVGLAALIVVSSTSFFVAEFGDALFAMAVGIGAWALGDAARGRRVAIREESKRAVADEQARIARELHDVIAHSVSVIVVQAAAADDVFEQRPEQAREAIRSIERAGRESLRELRLLLGAVRPDGGSDGTDPQPGLGRLEELAEPLRAGGLEVDIESEGAAADLPAGVELSAYRIVQEALTNTLRHAGASRAAVRVRYDPAWVEVEVSDDGRGAAGGEGDGGHGLIGMRERASMLGGTLEAGPLPEGGYRVRARLPLEPAS